MIVLFVTIEVIDDVLEPVVAYLFLASLKEAAKFILVFAPANRMITRIKVAKLCCQEQEKLRREKWWAQLDLNQRPADYESDALTN